jgi:hypothetical protein
MMDETEAEQSGAARRGGRAKGGTAPQPGDPDTPQARRKRTEQDHAEMRKAGFGTTIGSEDD